MKKVVFIVLLIIFGNLNLFAQSEITKEEYEIYAAVLKILYTNREHSDGRKNVEYVILDTTLVFKDSEQNTSQGEPINDEEIQKAAKEFVSVVKKSQTSKDFEAKNKISSSLKNLLPTNYKYSLTTKEEIDRIIQIGAKEFDESQKKRKIRLMGDDGTVWKYFYQKYPNADGYYQLSRVGFNSKKTWAQVYVEGNGSVWTSNLTYILRKKKGIWKIYTAFGGESIS